MNECPMLYDANIALDQRGIFKLAELHGRAFPILSMLVVFVISVQG
jgi:hypothetical protein